jgi:hypothetical protein
MPGVKLIRASILPAVIAAALVSTLSADTVTVTGRTVDETGVAVAGVRVEISSQAGGRTAISDRAGNFSVELPAVGDYQVRAEQQGFFVFQSKSVPFQPGGSQLTITLNHLQEFAESVEVAYSPPAIDPKEPDEQKQLTNIEILNVPYPASQDLRSALPMFQGVVQDISGNPHFNGGASNETNYTLDNFNISDPYTGRLEARVDIEAVQSLDLESGRFSVERGRGSAGSLDIKTRMGDDHWRFSGTNFIPGITGQNGVLIDKWTPRIQFSGPIAKGRAWFHNGFDTFYDVNTVHELPAGQNRSRSVTGSNLSRFQVNLTPSNILTASLLVNYNDDNHRGLSFLNPIETTLSQRQHLYVGTVRDQFYFSNGALVDAGFADSRGLLRQSPLGNQIYEITPFGHLGNYFVDLTRHIYRQEWVSNAFLPTLYVWGSHQLKVGADFERTSVDRFVNRHDYEVLRIDKSVARRVTFTGNRQQQRRNFEASNYAQDRWSPREGLTVEIGVRADWNQIIRDVLISPRLSASYAPGRMRDTKFAAGFGIFYDTLPLATLMQPQDQFSQSTFFLPNGQVRGPVETAFVADQRNLDAPRHRISSVSVERKLPFDFYGKAAYTHKVGSQGFTFVNELVGASNFEGGLYQLRNWRHDRYDSSEFTIRKTFGRQYEWVAGYTRSSARTNAAVDYNLENPIFGPQGPGPLPWDTPNRFLTWGWAPLPKRVVPHILRFLVGETDVLYLVEYRTGFPFSIVNEDGFLVGAPNSRRLPSYFDINLHFERKFRFLHYLWAWRFGFNNITNNGNPNVVNNNIDSPAYLAYGRGQLRAFAVRLRFLGKK